MSQKNSRKLVASLDVIPFARTPGVLEWVACALCTEPLGLHQPDPQDPDRLLGICQECHRWYLIEMMEEPGEAMMIMLPDGAWLLEAYEADGSGISSVKPPT